MRKDVGLLPLGESLLTEHLLQALQRVRVDDRPVQIDREVELVLSQHGHPGVERLLWAEGERESQGLLGGSDQDQDVLLPGASSGRAAGVGGLLGSVEVGGHGGREEDPQLAPELAVEIRDGLTRDRRLEGVAHGEVLAEGLLTDVPRRQHGRRPVVEGQDVHSVVRSQVLVLLLALEHKVGPPLGVLAPAASELAEDGEVEGALRGQAVAPVGFGGGVRLQHRQRRADVLLVVAATGRVHGAC
mmetsp:Transcript_15109/g.38333  ORF Transcript_15109/g.38333 Transcript_15109/m.38333 type:complete len:244 (+) Transcript_15109:892-1623(+)